MKKHLLTLFAVGVSMVGSYAGRIAEVEITSQEKAQMLNEADDFIDEIPEGQQDRQADAVLHALQGSAEELQQVRKSGDVVPGKYSDNVVVREICPLDGPARGINMRLYRPKGLEGKKLPLLVYFHGGGWAIGSLNSCASFCDAMATTGKACVLAVDYSLAPEHPFPRGLSDCIAATEYAFANAAELGTSPGLISLGGDSAGGNLALAAALYFGENKNEGDGIRSLVLYYPVVTLDNEKSGSWKEYSRGYGLDRRLMDAFIKAYDDEGKAPDTLGNISKGILKSPGTASDEMLKRLPPILIISAERDILSDQINAFANKMTDSGNDVEIEELPGTVHLFMTVPGQPTAFKKAISLTSDYLKY